MAGLPVQAASPGGGSGAENGDDTLPSRVSAAQELASAFLSSSADPPARLLRDHSPALEFLKDEAGRLVYYNQRVRERLRRRGGSPSSASGDPEWLPPASAESVRRHDQTVSPRARCSRVEETLPTPAGPRHWLVAEVPAAGSESGVRLVGAVAVDISERRRREVDAPPHGGHHGVVSRRRDLDDARRPRDELEHGRDADVRLHGGGDGGAADFDSRAAGAVGRDRSGPRARPQRRERAFATRRSASARTAGRRGRGLRLPDPRRIGRARRGRVDRARHRRSQARRRRSSSSSRSTIL